MPTLVILEADTDESAEVLSALPRPVAQAVRKALSALPEQRFSVAYTALRGCGYGDDVRRTLAQKVADIATVLAEGEEPPTPVRS